MYAIEQKTFEGTKKGYILRNDRDRPLYRHCHHANHLNEAYCWNYLDALDNVMQWVSIVRVERLNGGIAHIRKNIGGNLFLQHY